MKIEIDENRLRNIGFTLDLQKDINSRITQCIAELSRISKVDIGSGEKTVLNMLDSIQYVLEERSRFIYK